MTTGTESSDWSARLAAAVADEVKRLRKVRGMSAQQLADRCAEIGAPIPRSVIANFESKRRLTISAPEVIALATALDVPPMALLFPIGFRDSIEYLPAFNVSPLEAMDFFSGSATPPPVNHELLASHQVFLYRKHKMIEAVANSEIAKIRRLELELAEFSGGPDDLLGSRLEVEIQNALSERIRALKEMEENQAYISQSGLEWDQASSRMRRNVELSDSISELMERDMVLRRELHDYEEKRVEFKRLGWARESALNSLRAALSDLHSLRKILISMGAGLPVVHGRLKEALDESIEGLGEVGDASLF